MKNKVAGFVSKVNRLSQARVKKGDVILEYDDLDLRTQIENLKNTIAEQERKKRRYCRQQQKQYSLFHLPSPLLIPDIRTILQLRQRLFNRDFCQIV